MAPGLKLSAAARHGLGPGIWPRLAEEWGGAPLRAAVRLQRPDVLALDLEAMGLPFITPRIYLGPELREKPNAATRSLPGSDLLLILDRLGVLRLIRLKGVVKASVRNELMQWPVQDVTVKVKQGRGKFRAVEITFDETTLLLAGTWKGDNRRALELIEEATAGHG